ncbi:MAG: hypothetical protein MJ229_01690 [bacterium]|nr:hypothetical protein [bacterium]
MNFKDKIMNFPYQKLFNNLSFIIIEFLFVIFLLANIGFILHIPITWIYLIIALLIVYFSLIKLNNSFKDVNLQFFGFLSLIIISLLVVNGRGDYSFDGASYHFQAMFCLKNGWNPLLQDSISFGEKYHLYANHTWVQIWPKFCETVSACFYQLTDIIESGFVVNCLIACAVFFRSITVLSLFSERKYLNLLFSSLIILNPVVIAQFFTMYVDLIMYFMFILFILNIMEIIKQDKFSNFNFWNLVFIGSIMPNLKITGLFYLAIISIIFLFTYKKYAKTYLKACLVIFILIASVSIHPYFTNYKIYKSPFYTKLNLMSDAIVEKEIYAIQLKNTNFLKKTFLSNFSIQTNTGYANLKFPFQIREEELFCPDIRIGGLGQLWSGIFLLSVLLLIGMEIKDKTDKKLYYSISAITLLSFLLHSEAWWSRYVAQIWFFPLFSLYMSIIYSNKLFLKNLDFKHLFCTLFIIILFCNSTISMREIGEFRSLSRNSTMKFFDYLSSFNEILIYKSPKFEGDSTMLTYLDKYNIKYRYVSEEYYLKHSKDFVLYPKYFICDLVYLIAVK